MDYKSHGNDCFWWIDKAEELLISSTILEEAYRSGMAKGCTKSLGEPFKEDQSGWGNVVK